MADAWTRIAKPTGDDWIRVPSEGKVPYNSPVIMYNSPIITYNGGDGFDWIDVPKPTT